LTKGRPGFDRGAFQVFRMNLKSIRQLFPRCAILFEQKWAFGYLNPANARK
jgi:hypothetical protein